jgi:hypothetical protein
MDGQRSLAHLKIEIFDIPNIVDSNLLCNWSLVFFLIYHDSLSCRRTICVTRAGAGGGTPSDWENAEA